LEVFLGSRDDLAAVPARFGTTCFPRLLSGEVDALCRLLRERYDTAVVPGHFFEQPDRFRIGLGCDTAQLRGGLERLGAALDSRRVGFFWSRPVGLGWGSGGGPRVPRTTRTAAGGPRGPPRPPIGGMPGAFSASPSSRCRSSIARAARRRTSPSEVSSR